MSQCDICQRTVIYTVRLDVPNLSSGADEVYACGACRAGIATYIESYTAYVQAYNAHQKLSDAERVLRNSVQADNRSRYRFVPSCEWQLADNDLHVFTLGTKPPRLIGYIEGRFAMNFLAGDASRFRPIDGWKNTFSPDLIERLGLPKPKQETP